MERTTSPDGSGPKRRLGRRRAARRGQRGAAIVELALALPLLALLVMGVVDLGRAYRLKTRLANAAREGAAYAQYFPSQVDNTGTACADPANVVFIARNEAGGPEPYAVAVARASDGVPITGCNRTTVAPGTPVRVSTSAPFTVLTPLVADLVGETLTLRASVQIVVQG